MVIGEILLEELDIQKRVQKLGEEISSDYKVAGIDHITIVAITNGAVIFTADLMRQLDLQADLECISVRSYFDKTSSESAPKIVDSSHLEIAGRHILLIDDIVDTGKTSDAIINLLEEKNVASVKCCMLLDKHERRQVSVNVDYTGFTIPDAFVVGYGLDFAGKYRNLPHIAVLESQD